MVQQSHHRHPAGSEKLATIERGLPMTRDVTARPRAILPANKLSALVLGAAAIGALAIGALAIGHVAVGRLVIRKARLGALEVDDLTVRRLRVVEHEGPSS